MLVKSNNIIVRKIDGTPEGYTAVRIDRKTVFGNLSRISSTQNRTEVIAKHKSDLAKDIKAKGYLYKQLRKLARRVVAGEKLCLECHCYPKPCHGNNLVVAINSIALEERSK